MKKICLSISEQLLRMVFSTFHGQHFFLGQNRLPLKFSKFSNLSVIQRVAL